MGPWRDFLPLLPLYNLKEFGPPGSKSGERPELFVQKVDIDVESCGGLAEWVE